ALHGGLAPGPVPVDVLDGLTRDGGVGGAGNRPAGGNGRDTHDKTPVTPLPPVCLLCRSLILCRRAYRLIRRSRRNHGNPTYKSVMEPGSATARPSSARPSFRETAQRNAVA